MKLQGILKEAYYANVKLMYLLLPSKDVKVEDEARIAQRLSEVVTLGSGLDKKDSSSVTS